MINTRKNAGRVIAGLLSTPGWMPPASAQAPPIIVDRTAAGAQPVLETRDGVPVIQIAPPSAGGISHNRYLAFNVGPAGAILNNGGDGNATQLIGPIAGNPYLEAGPAATILNEVTAPNPSELRGMLEVAGQPAHVIVANPAGITCDGCGWLNSSRATLTTGRPGIGPEGRLTLEVTSGALSIQGAGLDGRQVKQIDLLARVLTLNAGVWADQLHVGTGPARVDADSGEIDPIPGQGSRPEVAIDAAALGGMYANSIRLVGSEAGVGVNLGGHLHALTGDLTLTAAGEVHIAPHAFLTAKGLLAIHTATRLDSHGRSSPGEQARNRDEGRMQAHTVSLTAQDALRLTAARIEAETVSLSSGGNIDLFSEDESRAMSSVRHPFPYRASHLYAANLSVQAGNDFQTRGMHMVIDRDASLHAARDIQFHDSILLPTDSAAERYDASSLSPHGAAQLTRESLPGHAALSDGTLQEARTATGQRPAALRLTAGRDVVIQSGSFHESASSYGRERDESLLWVRVKTTRRSQAGTSVRPAVLNGQDVEIVADQDIQVRGAEIRAQGDLILSARRDVTISAGVNERESHHVEHIRETGLGTMGRWSLGRSTRTRVWEQADRTFTASVIDSVTGTTTIQGGNAVTLQASRVLAPEGDIALGAKRIELHDMSGRRQTRISAANAHGGIAFAVGTPALAAWQVMNQVNDAQKSTPSRLTQALLVSASGLAIDHARAVISEQHKVAGGVLRISSEISARACKWVSARRPQRRTWRRPMRPALIWRRAAISPFRRPGLGRTSALKAQRCARAAICRSSLKEASKCVRRAISPITNILAMTWPAGSALAPL